MRRLDNQNGRLSKKAKRERQEQLYLDLSAKLKERWRIYSSLLQADLELHLQTHGYESALSATQLLEQYARWQSQARK